MAEALSAPLLLATIDGLRARERRRRRDAALRRTLVAVALSVIVIALWRIADRVWGRAPLPVLGAVALVAVVFAIGAAFVLRGALGRSDREMSREMDRRLGLDDRASAALALVRGDMVSSLAAYVIHDAERALAAAAPRVDMVFPAKAERRVTWLVRCLGWIALGAVVLAVIAELLLLEGPIKILPGISIGGGEPHEILPPTDEAPVREGPKPGPGPAPKPKEPEPEKDEEKPAPPEPETAKADIRASMKMSKDEYDAEEPVVATIAASATGELASRRTFDVRVSVDGVEVDTGATLTVDPARPGGDRVDVDLRLVPGLKLGKGQHMASARLTTRTSHEEHASEPVTFRIVSDKDDSNDGGGGKKPKPQPEPSPGAPEKKQEQPNAPGPPVPPVVTERQVVVPLFGEGDLVKKKGLVLVLDPAGGTDAPPGKKPLGDALPEAKRRAEVSVDLAKLSEPDRALVRRYFELLEGLGR